MYIKQHYLGCLAQASYTIADQTSKRAAIVDPRRDVDVYLQEAVEQGFTITHVILTHFHADFVAGHLELREQTGAQIVLGKRAQAEFPFMAVGDGDCIRLGHDASGVCLRFLETPGHTPEGICITVHQGLEAAPHCVMTGDTLFLGGVGRPDLMASVGVTADELGGQLYDSLRHKLMTLPPDTIVYPGHGAGSSCGKGMSNATQGTIGEQLKVNPALRPELDRSAFIAEVNSGQPFAPAYFAFAAGMNKRERATLGAAMETGLSRLTLEDTLRLQNSGVQIVDTRSCDAYSEGHLDGAYYVGLQGQYATWCGALLSHERDIVVIADRGREAEAVLRLGRIGYDRVLGYLDQSMESVSMQHPEMMERVENIAPADAAAFVDDPHTLFLDVRADGEWDAGHIEGALHIPLHQLDARVAEIPQRERVIVHCAGGYRSLAACAVLKRHGLHHLKNMLGGYQRWQAEVNAVFR